MVNAALSQVDALRDLTRMKKILSEHVFSGQDVSSCRILHFRYKPGRTWIVSYAISLAAADNEQIVYLRACERRGSAARYTKSRGLEQNVRHIPGLDSVAWIFPSDRKLRGLPALCDETNLSSNVLPVITAAAYGPGWRLKNWSREIVHYLPERSCMMRLDATLRSASEPVREISAGFYGKVYPDDQGAETYRYLSELWEGAGHPGARFRVAKPLLYQPDSATMWQLGIQGAGLDVQSRSDLQGAAAALAALHRSYVAGLPPYQSTASRLDTTAEVIGAAMPDHRDGTVTLIRRLQSQSAHLSRRPLATLHGDLHLKNFIVSDDGVALIDLDTLAAGDALEDIASFAAALCSGGLAGGIPEQQTRECVAVFVQAYERAAGWHVPEFDLNWHIAAALTTERALRAVTRMKADSPTPDVLLNIARDFAELAEDDMARVEALV